MTAFRQVMAKLQDGQRDEALIGLDFVLRLDPAFSPGLEIQKQLASGEQEFDLSGLLSHIDAPSTDEINMLLIEAVEEFNQHNYVEAQKKVTQVLLELPGHTEARNLQHQIASAMKVETQVGHFLAQAREALDRGDPQEAVNFVVMAQALDPHHKGIQAMLGAIDTEHAPVAAAPEPPAQTEEPAAPALPSDEAAEGSVAPDFGFQPAAESAQPETPADSFDGAFNFDVPDEFDIASDDDGPSPNQTIAIDSWDVDGAFEEPGPDEPAPAAAAPVPKTLFSAPAETDAIDSFSSGDVADLFSSGSSDGGFDAPDPGQNPSPELPPPPIMGSSEPPDFPAIEQEAPPESAGPAFDESSASDISDLFEAPVEPSQPDGGAAAPDQQVRDLLDAAERAWTNGSPGEAKLLVEEVLGSVPNNVEAIELMARLEVETQGETPTLPPPPDLDDSLLPPELTTPPPPTLADDDLFDSDFDETEDEEYEPEPEDEVEEEAPLKEAKQRRKISFNFPGGEALENLPWRVILMAAGGLLLVLIATIIGLGLFSGEDSEEQDARAITELLSQADDLFKQGHQERAIELLTEHEAEGLEKQRIDKRIERYQKELIPPTPTPIPDALVTAQERFDQGRWFAAYEEVVVGLNQYPDDTELGALKETILDFEPALDSLFSLIREKDFAEASVLANDLAERHPDQPEIGATQDRCLFNAALANLRSYNLAAARSHLLRLQSRNPDDEEIKRILRFVTSYINRPVDMQLEIFVGSLENR